MKNTVYMCDVCGKVKGKVNHWWVVCLGAGDPLRMVILPWTDASAVHDDFIHLCGQECVHKKLDEFMSEH